MTATTTPGNHQAPIVIRSAADIAAADFYIQWIAERAAIATLNNLDNHGLENGGLVTKQQLIDFAQAVVADVLLDEPDIGPVVDIASTFFCSDFERAIAGNI